MNAPNETETPANEPEAITTTSPVDDQPVDTQPVDVPVEPPALHLLPVNLGPLADSTEKDTKRWATQGVKLDFDGYKFTAVATDCKELIVVTGENMGLPEE